MKIHNVRLGLANNSSSTHSIIIMDPSKYASVGTDEDTEFSWDYFTAASPEAKRNYLGIVLREALRDKFDDQTARIIIDALQASVSDDAYIDHQSLFALPSTWDGKGVDLDFYKALVHNFMTKPVVILGGNDNDDIEHPLINSGRHLPLRKLEGHSLVARNDGTHWVIFNRKTGAKIRLSFDDREISHARVPELVDIKITDFCPYGCSYCYQSSTKFGIHSDKSYLNNIVASLGNLKVFEVALGGGEPTLHPNFRDLLRYFRYHGIVPNFTTRNLGWMANKDKRDAILDTAGSFAVSVNTSEDVDNLTNAMASWPKTSCHTSLQYVLGTGGNLEGVLEAIRSSKIFYGITLLGYKSVGFGVKFNKIEEDWITPVKKAAKKGYINIGVDTAVIDQYENELIEDLKVNPVLMTKGEGRYSAYIDAVTKRMAPSSYCSDLDYVPLEPTSEKITEIFQSWQNSLTGSRS